MLLRGLSDKLIASELRFTYGAARRHVDSLLRKFKVSSRLQLVTTFLSNVVISPR
jgi:DNA-binding NarL/FixJ family response regulator